MGIPGRGSLSEVPGTLGGGQALRGGVCRVRRGQVWLLVDSKGFCASLRGEAPLGSGEQGVSPSALF